MDSKKIIRNKFSIIIMMMMIVIIMFYQEVHSVLQKLPPLSYIKNQNN